MDDVVDVVERAQQAGPVADVADEEPQPRLTGVLLLQLELSGRIGALPGGRFTRLER